MAVDIAVAEEALIDTDAVVAGQLTVGAFCKNQSTPLNIANKDGRGGLMARGGSFVKRGEQRGGNVHVCPITIVRELVPASRGSASGGSRGISSPSPAARVYESIGKNCRRQFDVQRARARAALVLARRN